VEGEGQQQPDEEKHFCFGDKFSDDVALFTRLQTAWNAEMCGSYKFSSTDSPQIH